MRSYEAARSLFSMLSTLAWGLIFIGGILAYFGGASATEMVRWNGGSALLAFFMGMIPGLGLAMSGFWSLVFAQIGRAGVDTAEYSQQMLQISRDQLEVSRQTLRRGEPETSGFEALKPESSTERPMADFATRFAANGQDHEQAQKSPAVTEALPHGAILHLGQTILQQSGKYRVGDQIFNSIAAAKHHAEFLNENK